MKEESLFEKQTIARLHRVAVPRSIVKERMKSEAHSNYESVV